MNVFPLLEIQYNVLNKKYVGNIAVLFHLELLSSLALTIGFHWVEPRCSTECYFW